MEMKEKRIEHESRWFDNVQIEIRLVHCPSAPEKNFYQVMRIHPRECVTPFMHRQQAINYCKKEELNIVRIIDDKSKIRG